MAGLFQVILTVIISTVGYCQVLDFSCPLLRPSSITTSPQAPPLPYVIEVSRDGSAATTYAPGDTLTVTVSSSTPDPTPIAQIYITASSALVSETSTSFLEGWSPTATTQTCNEAPTVQEYIPDVSVFQAIFTWTSPSGQVLPVDGFVFRATIVLDSGGLTYWENIQSNVITPDNTGLMCPSNQTGEVELGTSAVAVTWEIAPAGSSLGCNPASGANFSVGTTEVFCVLLLSGNFELCQFFVTVLEVDTTPPTISDCPSDQMVTTDFISFKAVVEWTVPSATDLSGVAFPISQPLVSSGDEFEVGETSASYSFSDSSGNIAHCNFLITVIAVGPLPSSVIDVCPVDIATTLELGTPNVQVSWIEPVPTGVPVAVTLMENTHSPGDLFMSGMTTVSYLFQDAQGNSLACEFVVTVVTAPPNAPPNVTCPFLESKIPIEEVMSMSSCEDRESPAGDLTTMCTYSTSSPSLVVLRCTCTDGDGAETYCEVDIPVIPTTVTTPRVSTTPVPYVSTEPSSKNQSDRVLVTKESTTMAVVLPEFCSPLNIDNTDIVCVGPKRGMCTIACTGGTLNSIPSREVFNCKETEDTAFWSPRPIQLCQSPSKPLYVSNQMVIPLDTNAEDCVGARRPDEDISKFFSDFTTVSFAVFCSETNIPYCEASLRGTDVTQNCSTFVGSVRRRRQTNSEVEIAITLEIRTNLTKEDFQSFLESMRMQILNSGARRVPVSGSYTAQLTDDNIAGIVVGQKFTFACNQGYSKFHEDVCVICPPGTKEENGVCKICQRGSYQNLAGQTFCRQCNQKEGVLAGSSSITDCQQTDTEDEPSLSILVISFMILACILGFLLLCLLAVMCAIVCCGRGGDNESHKHDKAGNFIDMRSDGLSHSSPSQEDAPFKDSDDEDSALGASEPRYQTADGTDMFIAIEDESVDADFEIGEPTYDEAPVTIGAPYEEEMSAL
ncbi:uncharacterized protein [Apostichopus japonicus]|uniref:uncharacterized protein isoform X2 n=1 Tax=Stichopus japonicus TaxID=307972 RepID=UPI003AB5DE3C